MKELGTVLIPTSLLVLAQAAMAGPTFTDNTFNLTDYTITKSLQFGTGTVSQTVNGGNPGSALSVDYVVTGAPPFTNAYGSIYYLNNGFTYDPSASGALSTISWSIDKKVVVVQANNVSLVNGQGFIIYQGGNYYSSGITLPSTFGVYLTASEPTSFSDFSLVTDLASGAVNSAVHPSFASGVMQFGFRNGYAIAPQTPIEVVLLQDNFAITLNPVVAPVPEPGTYLLLLIGLGLILPATARRRPSAAARTW